MTGRLRIAVVLSGAGHLVHNVEEFGLAILTGPETLFPVTVTLLFLWRAERPTRPYLVTLGAWVTLVLVAGGGSVFPLPFLPFVPEQTVSYYLAHLAYALLQIPALAMIRRVGTPRRSGAAARRVM